MKPALGNFVMRHAESAALYNKIIVVHVVSADEDNLLITDHVHLKTITVYYKKSSRLTNFFYWRRAWKKGIQRAEDEFGSKPDLVHLNIIFPAGIIASAYSLKNKLPLIITEHSTIFHRKLNCLERYVIRKTVRTARLICPVSAHLGRAIQQLGIHRETFVVLNVVNTDLFKPVQKINQIRKKILHVSTLNEHQKNITGMLRVIKRLSAIRDDFILEIISEFDFSNAESYAAALGLDNKFISFQPLQPIEKVAEAMQQADVFILFSNTENMPCVLLEAVACGLPVITTKVGGISEQINDSCGILIDKGDEDALLKNLTVLLDHPERFDASGMHNHIHSICSYEAVGKQFNAIYQRIVSDKK
ncbi:MAG: glycosyltransferase family 4 protein [Bacteroidia bacterium]|nr:glycosyltransferase family 4 protein [Bacteroidia bacterium]